MKNKLILFFLASGIGALSAFSFVAGKLVSTKTHIRFFSSTPVEDIEANNYTSVSTIDTKSGDVVFSVPIQSFQFEKALMQKHFNSKDFLDSKTYPKAKFTGKITNLSDINFEKNGAYDARIQGDLTIKGNTNSINEKGIITVDASGINVQSKFDITLSDYGIIFEKGKPSSNIAKTVEVTLIAEYKAG